MTNDEKQWTVAEVKTDKTLTLNARQKRDLKKAFDYFDTSGSGQMETADLKVAFRALGFEPRPDELKKRIEEVDKEGKGFFSFDEFLQVMSKKMIEKDEDEEVVKAFRLFDHDGTSHISVANLKRAASKLGKDITDEELVEMVDEADDSGMKQVTIRDFRNVMNRGESIYSKDATSTYTYPKNHNYFYDLSQHQKK